MIDMSLITDKPYLVLSALRGPDLQGTILADIKAVITARIRAMVFDKDECPGSLYNSTPLKTADRLRLDTLRQDGIEFANATPTNYFAVLHYLSHLETALGNIYDNRVISFDDLQYLKRYVRKLRFDIKSAGI